jgi:hypothetical protein
MYKHRGGIVLLDDIELRYLDPRWVRRNVCEVGQGTGVVLEGESILENITLGVEGAKEEMIEDTCRAALFHEFVRDLSDGYETILGGGAAGVALSGGQKQRLASYCEGKAEESKCTGSWLVFLFFRLIFTYFFLFSNRRSYVGPGPHLSHFGIQSSQALALKQDNYRYHT